MIPLQRLAQIHYDGRAIELSQRGEFFYLMVDRYPIRSTETKRIEEVAVIRVCEPLAVKRQPRVLLEGLGLGTAVAKAEQVLAPRAKIVVSEPLREAISWHGSVLPPLPKSPQPEHFRIRNESLATTLAHNPATFDAVVVELDYAIDPFLTSEKRKDHYFPPLSQVKDALRPLGKLAIHCENRAPILEKALEQLGFQVDHLLEAPHKRSKARHHIMIATLPAEEG